MITLIEKLIDNKNFFSTSILELLKHNVVNNGVLDAAYMQLLYEITNGAKMKELIELLHLSKSGIEKRRRAIKEKFGDRFMSDRDMILAAKEKGFV